MIQTHNSSASMSRAAYTIEQLLSKSGCSAVNMSMQELNYLIHGKLDNHYRVQTMRPLRTCRSTSGQFIESIARVISSYSMNLGESKNYYRLLHRVVQG